MVCCVVTGCNSNSDLDKQISFFQFPLKNPTLLNQWLNHVKRKKGHIIPKKTSKVCHKHFTHDSFEESSDNEFLRRVGLDDSLLKRSKRKLKENAIPTVFDFSGNEFPKKARSAYKKRRKEMLINELINTDVIQRGITLDQPSTSAAISNIGITNAHKKEAEEESLDNSGIYDNLEEQIHRRSCGPQTNYKTEVQTNFMQNHSHYYENKDDQEELPVIIAGETFMWEGKETPVISAGETLIPERNEIPSESLVTVKIEMPELTTSSESFISEENKMQFDSPGNKEFLQNTFNIFTREKNSQVSRGTQTDNYDLEIENSNLRLMISQLEENLKQFKMQAT